MTSLQPWESFAHASDVGVRGRGETLERAFEHAALALTSVVTDPARVSPRALRPPQGGDARARPGSPRAAQDLRAWGQPVLIGGSMGTASYVLAGTREGGERSFASACHGAGRSLSRNEASRRFGGREVVDELAARGILIRAGSKRGIAEEAPGAYKDVVRVVEATQRAGLARIVARLEPVVCVKG